MNEHKFNTEQIESYLRNELPAKEKFDFEQMCEKDPVLKGELQFQKEIVAALQNYRKSELKQRLNMVMVDYPTSIIPWINYMKVAAFSLGFVGLSYVSAVYVYPQFSNDTDNTLSQLTSVSRNIPKYIPTIKIESSELSNPTLKNEEKVAENIVPPVYANQNYQSNTGGGNVIKVDNPNNQNITGTVKDDKSSDVTVGPDTIKTKLLYRYYENKLSLYNHTSGGIQFTLDIDGATHYFLYYGNVFYHLEPGQEELKELEPVTNSLIIERLNVEKANLKRNK